MSNYFDAIIFASQNPCFPGDENDTLTPQLFRTAKYCFDKDLVIIKTFLECNPLDDDKTFYHMINYINSLHQSVAVVFDSAEQLPTHDFGKIVILDFMLDTTTIEIHLVKENVALIDTHKQCELNLWSKYTHTNPKRMKSIRDGIDLYKELRLNTDYGLRTNLV
ncbi:MAG: hypothetical protein E7007_01495 [Alphaproteobacteria bacterium]|nr:hypothetical protein [Alphaproteobacteria bacterium]